MEIKRSTAPAVTAGEELSTTLEHYQDKPTLLLLSGGSALSILDYVSNVVLGPKLTITTLDERFSTDLNINNFAQIKATEFYERARGHGASEIDTSISSDDSLQETGQRFEASLQDWREKHPDGIMIATMGVGADGHTAGIFPNQPSFDYESDNWVVAHELTSGANPYAKRITVTLLFLKTQVTHAIGYIISEEKRSVFDSLQNDSFSLKELPACILKEMASVVVITDLY